MKQELSAYWRKFQATPEQERRVENDVFDSFVTCYIRGEEDIQRLQKRLEAIERAFAIAKDALIRIGDARIEDEESLRAWAGEALMSIEAALQDGKQEGK